MAYTKTAWINDAAPPVDAINLNKIEQGIYDAHQMIAAFQGTPSGAAYIWPFETLPAGGFLWADGAAVSRAAYPGLHAYAKDVGGTNNYGWGAGDGSTTFNVPKLSHRFLIGKGTHADINALAKTEGEASLAKLTPKHGHTTVQAPHSHETGRDVHSLTPGSTGFSMPNPGGTFDFPTDAQTITISVGPQDRLLDTVPFVVVNFIIKT